MKRTRKVPPGDAAHPKPLHAATPEALAKALLRPLTPPSPALRKSVQQED